MQELISKRLRHRVRTLGEILGETMTAQHGEGFLAKVEEIRHLAKSRRQHNSDTSGADSNDGDASAGSDHDKLRQVLTSLDDSNLIFIARAFNQFLNLSNIAEQAESTEADTGAESHLANLFEQLQAQGVTADALRDTLTAMRCDLVLTAHPTEITRRTLIQKYNRIAAALADVN
ncbi:MAG: phosphoenolpyruvate carboxylase, partial [Pseudomonadales bacterium]